VHGRFLRALASRLERRSDIFRVVLKPGDRRHDNHFHLDASPPLTHKILQGILGLGHILSAL